MGDSGSKEELAIPRVLAHNPLPLFDDPFKFPILLNDPRALFIPIAVQTMFLKFMSLPMTGVVVVEKRERWRSAGHLFIQIALNLQVA